MTPRERTLALVMIGTLVLSVGAVGGYFLVLKPLQTKRAEAAKLRDEIDKLEGEERAQTAAAKKLVAARAHSLPADIDLAKREYVVVLNQLLAAAGAPPGSPINEKVTTDTARTVPEISKGKPIYKRVVYEVEIKKADMWVIKDFLKGYYELGLLHQITYFSIKKDDDNAKGPVRRNDLTVKLTTEAILLEGAENRRTLLSVPTAFVAVGGGMMFQAMRATPEAARGVVPAGRAQTLATNGRDYRLIVLKDPFNGPLPPPPPFQLYQPKDVVVKQDADRPTVVKVAVAGEGAQGARVRATVSGTLFPEGELKVDPKSLAIELPKTSAAEGTATVAVLATSVEGKTEKTSFKVSVEKATEKPPPPEKVDTRDEVSGAIILTMLTFRSDGTASASIRDGANKQRYAVEIERGAVKITKEKFGQIFDEKTKGPRMGWKEDEAHKKLAAGVINLSDDTSRTNRTFKVVAVDPEGLILADLRPDGAVAAAPVAKQPGKFGGGFPGGGWPPKGGAPKQGPANPLSAVAGGMAGTIPAAPSKLYRWVVGDSLAAIKSIPDAKAKEIIKQADTSGPMFPIAVTTDK